MDLHKAVITLNNNIKRSRNLVRYDWSVREKKIKKIKKYLPFCSLLSCIRTWEILRTLERKKKLHESCASPCTSLVFLKITRCSYNSTMHSGTFFISLLKSTELSFTSWNTSNFITNYSSKMQKCVLETICLFIKIFDKFKFKKSREKLHQDGTSVGLFHSTSKNKIW